MGSIRTKLSWQTFLVVQCLCGVCLAQDWGGGIGDYISDPNVDEQAVIDLVLNSGYSWNNKQSLENDLQCSVPPVKILDGESVSEITGFEADGYSALDGQGIAIDYGLLEGLLDDPGDGGALCMAAKLLDHEFGHIYDQCKGRFQSELNADGSRNADGQVQEGEVEVSTLAGFCTCICGLTVTYAELEELCEYLEERYEYACTMINLGGGTPPPRPPCDCCEDI